VRTSTESFVSEFRRARSGNLWRHYDGKTLVVFSRKDGMYGWGIFSEDDEKTWSRRAYDSEEDALSALEDYVSDF
jgi:hypothetical protein